MMGHAKQIVDGELLANRQRQQVGYLRTEDAAVADKSQDGI